MSKTITYENKEGYVGKLYGESSMVIMHWSGTPYMHTGSRSINTYEELKEAVDNYPEFIKSLEEGLKEGLDDLEEDI